VIAACCLSTACLIQHLPKFTLSSVHTGVYVCLQGETLFSELLRFCGLVLPTELRLSILCLSPESLHRNVQPMFCGIARGYRSMIIAVPRIVAALKLQTIIPRVETCLGPMLFFLAKIRKDSRSPTGVPTADFESFPFSSRDSAIACADFMRLFRLLDDTHLE